VRRVSMKELTQKSTAVLVGKCIKKQSMWNEKHTRIYTNVSIKTGTVIQGNPDSEAVITIPGGRVGNIVYEVSDMPVFGEGEEVLVFLWRHPSGKNLVTGSLQGKLTVIEDKKTGKRILQGGGPLMLNGTKTINPKTVRNSSVKTKLFLKDFIKEIKSFVKE